MRIALGARPEGVVRMVLRQGALLALAGTAAGLLAALALNRFLDGPALPCESSDPLAFVG